MSYLEYVCEEIKKYNKAEPIYSKTLADTLQNKFGMEHDKAVAACAVAVSRIMKEKVIPELRVYQKGIYYLTVQTVFGELGIDTERLIEDKYIRGEMGYEGGLALLHRAGLTTQMPNERLIVTNRAKNGHRQDKQLNIYIKPPRVEITPKNKAYLQVLDMLELLDNAPVDAQNPFGVIATHVEKNGLDFADLLILADRHYPRETVIKIAHVAEARGGLI
ncbi:MAG: hypothetical protein ACI3XF_06205 [Eubacteriales bacterium]